MSAQGEKRRAEILRFVRDYVAQHGYGPTGTAIGEHVGYRGHNLRLKHLDKMPEIYKDENGRWMSTTENIFLVLCELNVIVKKGDDGYWTDDITEDPPTWNLLTHTELSFHDAQDIASEYVRSHYPGENWRLLGSKMQDSGKCRVVFQRTDLAPDDNFWVLGEGFTAPLRDEQKGT